MSCVCALKNVTHLGGPASRLYGAYCGLDLRLPYAGDGERRRRGEGDRLRLSRLSGERAIVRNQAVYVLLRSEWCSRNPSSSFNKLHVCSCAIKRYIVCIQPNVRATHPRCTRTTANHVRCTRTHTCICRGSITTPPRASSGTTYTCPVVTTPTQGCEKTLTHTHTRKRAWPHQPRSRHHQLRQQHCDHQQHLPCRQPHGMQGHHIGNIQRHCRQQQEERCQEQHTNNGALHTKGLCCWL